MKQDVIDYIKNQLEERMQAAWGAMQAAQASANEESKSSAGDKHETALSMMHIEQEKLTNKLKEAITQKATQATNDLNPILFF